MGCSSELYAAQQERDEAVREASADLLDVLCEVREWISNWSPNFEQDEEWPAVRRRMNAAIAKAKGC